MSIVGYAGEAPPQFDHGRQLAGLIKGGADRGGVRFGHDKHAGTMRDADRGWQARRWTLQA